MKKAKKRSSSAANKRLGKSHAPTADELAEMAIRGEDVTKYYDLKSVKLHPGHGKVERVLSSKNLPESQMYSDDEIRHWLKADQFKDEKERRRVRTRLKRARNNAGRS